MEMPFRRRWSGIAQIHRCGTRREAGAVSSHQLKTPHTIVENDAAMLRR